MVGGAGETKLMNTETQALLDVLKDEALTKVFFWASFKGGSGLMTANFGRHRVVAGMESLLSLQVTATRRRCS